MAGRARTKQAGKHYELVHRPIRGTLNGHFIREDEDFSFCGLLKPWMNSVKQRVPRFEIFFDLQLQESDAEEKVEPTVEAEKSMENDSDNSELGVGTSLACLLTDPPVDSESLGDKLTISMIGDQPGVNPSNSILDASEAPFIVW